jgi:hypothetical protein
MIVWPRAKAADSKVKFGKVISQPPPVFCADCPPR